jgi:probable addiction module antidote protein
MHHPPSRPYGESEVVEELRDDPEYAAAYLSAVLEDGDQEELMLAMRRVAQAFGGVSNVAEQAELNAKSLYRMLSPKGNPELRSLMAVLKAMGMRLSVQPVTHQTPEHA